VPHVAPGQTSHQPFEYDPFSAAVQDDPYPYYRQLRAHYPAYYNQRRNFWTLSRFADVEAALRDWETFSSTGGIELDAAADIYPGIFGPGNMIVFDPPIHDRIRKVVQSAFTARTVAGLGESITRHVTALLNDMAEKGTADLGPDFCWRLPISTVSTVLGYPQQDVGLIYQWMFDLLARDNELDVVPEQARTAAAELAAYISEMLDTRLRRPRQDLLSVIAAAESAGALRRGESRGLCFILTLAGIDTSACLLSNGLHRLAGLPEIRLRCQNDPMFVSDVVEEILRFEAPVQGLARLATHDVSMHGMIIPAGSRVWLSFGSANRDERVFDNPDELCFTRTKANHLGFGSGLHRCVGAPLARLEARIALAAFFSRFAEYTLAGPSRRLHQHTDRGWIQLSAILTPT
jgi:cytochrome P450